MKEFDTTDHYPSPAEFFNLDGSLTDVGEAAGMRVVKLLAQDFNLKGAEIIAAYCVWRTNQWIEYQNPGYLRDLGTI